MTTSTDYLVVGAGASPMSFVDVILKDTDATVTIIDRGHAPGGHWNDERFLPSGRVRY
jgi:cation diffusion facilitator CzcD-associated flavoprotein CzcO